MDQWIKNLWNNNKIVFYLLIPLILIVKFHNLLIDWLISGAKQTQQSSIDKDKQFTTEINSLNNQANQLITQSNDLGKDQPPVDKDWYKEK